MAEGRTKAQIDAQRRLLLRLKRERSDPGNIFKEKEATFKLKALENATSLADSSRILGFKPPPAPLTPVETIEARTDSITAENRLRAAEALSRQQQGQPLSRQDSTALKLKTPDPKNLLRTQASAIRDL